MKLTSIRVFLALPGPRLYPLNASRSSGQSRTFRVGMLAPWRSNKSLHAEM